MKISLNWLKEYINLDGISTMDIIAKLTMSGLEVENYIDQNEIYKNIVVGYVKEKSKHPNADKLSLCNVSDGKEDFQVICGAPNVEANQKVVFAKAGAIVPKGNFKIGKAKIRGIESFGMICAEDELDLSDDHSGIMILEDYHEAGTSISKALDLNDVIMEIAITPNRPDALSHIGVARDLAAIYNLELKLPEIVFTESKEKVNDLASVNIIDEKNCPRYSAKVMKNIEIKESPDWLKKRLLNVGLRPINNIVDATNFVMFELGQPLHAFDLDLLKNHEIIVQSTLDETTFTTLDSKVRKLLKDTLMICDAEKNIAVAGVMGGENSEINNSTKNILIESAHFNSSCIRKTARNLGLSSEASYRFERGVDPNRTVLAAERAVQLIKDISSGEIAEGTIDIYPKKINKKEVRFRISRTKKILGYDISEEKIRNIFERLGFETILESGEEIHLKIPTYRPDIEREIDIIEEIARIYGYENIPAVSKINITLGEKHDESEFVDNIKNTANSLGFFEMINNPLQSESIASLTGNPIPVLNPQSMDMSHLRTSLLTSALLTVSKNIKVGEKDLMLFEAGNIFNRLNEKSIESFNDFEESKRLIFVLTGKKSQKEWNMEEKYFNFYSLKGYVNSFIRKFSLDNVLNDSYNNQSDKIYEYTFSKIHKKADVGTGGKINKTVLNHFDISQDVYCFEFDLEALLKVEPESKKFVEPLKYPKVIRDFAFIFDSEIEYNKVENYILKQGSGLLKSVSLFDIFESESLGKNKKSMAFTLEYYDRNKTLKEEEVEKEFTSLINAVTKEFNAKLRG